MADANEQELLELRALARDARDRVRKRRETEKRREELDAPFSGLVIEPWAVAARPETVPGRRGRAGVWWALFAVAAVGVIVAVSVSSSQPATIKTAVTKTVTVPVPVVVPTPIPAPAPASAPASGAPAAVKKKAIAKEEVEEEAPKKQENDGSLENLLNELPTAEAPGEKAAEEPAKEQEPTASRQSLSREDVNRVMQRVAPRVNACARTHDQTGTVMVHFSVEPTGQVADPNVKSDSADFAACVAAALAKARFPPFAGRKASFSYPFIATP